MMFVTSAFLLGFLGSLHCIGMCGPIALSLPGWTSKFDFITSRLIYNSGRIITYAILGGLGGLLSEVFAWMGFQNILSIGIGISLIAVILISKGSIITKFSPPGFTAIYQKLKAQFARLFAQKRKGTSFVIGMLNGLLPCGMVYIALAGAIAAGGWIESIIFMIAFGLGTFPAMFLISMGTPALKKLSSFQKVIPYFVVILGSLLLFRGFTVHNRHSSNQIQYDPNQVEIPISWPVS